MQAIICELIKPVYGITIDIIISMDVVSIHKFIWRLDYWQDNHHIMTSNGISSPWRISSISAITSQTSAYKVFIYLWYLFDIAANRSKSNTITHYDHVVCLDISSKYFLRRHFIQFLALLHTYQYVDNDPRHLPLWFHLR